MSRDAKVRILSILVLVLALAVVPTLAQGKVDPAVRVIHASPDAPGVDILVNDAIRAFENVEFGEATDYAELPAGWYNVKVVPTGGGPDSAVIEADLNLLYYQSYTVVAVNTLDSIEPIVLGDRALPPLPQRARVRFLHASPDAPAVDIKVVDGPYLFRNVAFKEIGEGVTVPAGDVDLEVRVAGTDTVVLNLPGVELKGGRNYTVVATGFAGGEEPGLGVVLVADRTNLPLGIRIGGGAADDEGDDRSGSDDDRGSIGPDSSEIPQPTVPRPRLPGRARGSRF